MITCEKARRNQPVIVCFAGSDWWYHNQGLFCPQVVKRLAKDHVVLYINSLGMRTPSLTKGRDAIRKIFRKLRSMIKFLRKVDENIYVFSPVSVPVLGDTFSKKLSALAVLSQVKLVMMFLGFKNPVFYVGCVPAYDIVKKLERSYLIYERTDLFEEMPGINKEYIISLDRELATSADLVLYVNKALWKEGLQNNKNSILIGHGVDFERFAKAEETGYVPEDIAELPKPVIGFFGDITEDVCDFSLLEYTAKTLTDVSLVLVGPISSNVTPLKRYKNIYFLGPKLYEEIPHYGKVFDVAIMPWKKNKWIEFCNPVKVKEYLALGKPIVSMYYPEIEPYSDVVYVAHNYEEFVSCIRTALKENDPGMIYKRREKVKNETWDSKVEQIKTFMERDLRGRKASNIQSAAQEVAR
jgi:glycosyltransferase involved in cell wall biosynthesis